VKLLAIDCSTDRLSLALANGDQRWQHEGAGGAQAAGTMGGANALASGLGQYLNYTGNQSMTNALRALPYGPNYGQYTPGSNTFVGPLNQ
jgi:hypothetical protein